MDGQPLCAVETQTAGEISEAQTHDQPPAIAFAARGAAHNGDASRQQTHAAVPVIVATRPTEALMQSIVRARGGWMH